jgi:hypothetical protein
MMATRSPLVTLLTIALVALACGVAHGATVTVYHTLETWTAAAGSPVTVENFDDLSTPGIEITFGTTANVTGCSAAGGCIAGGKYRDRAEDTQETKPRFTFSPAIKAFSAKWNLEVPTGPGTGIKLRLTFVTGAQMDVAPSIPNTTGGPGGGDFYGFVSDTAVTSMQFEEATPGTSPSNVETFDMDDARFVPFGPAVTTVAGNGTECAAPAATLNPCGDGGIATAAQLNLPFNVAVGADGIYFADRNNHRVRRVDLSGNITTVAGNGIPGFNGDVDGAGNPRLPTDAQLNSPTGVAVDDQGKIVIVDSGNHVIRLVDQAAHTITTIAGTPMTPGFQDGDQTSPTPPRFLFPRSVAIHPDGTLIVADPNNQRIRRVNVTDRVVTTLKGDGVPAFSNDPGARFNNPLSVSVDSAGNVIVADEGNHLIRRFSVVGNVVGNVETIAGSSAGFADGAGGTAQFDSPSGVAVDANTDTIIYVADLANNRIRRIVVSGAAFVVDTLAGGVEGFADAPLGGAAKFTGPIAVAAGASAVFVADLGNQRIRRIALPSAP